MKFGVWKPWTQNWHETSSIMRTLFAINTKTYQLLHAPRFISSPPVCFSAHHRVCMTFSKLNFALVSHHSSSDTSVVLFLSAWYRKMAKKKVSVIILDKHYVDPSVLSHSKEKKTNELFHVACEGCQIVVFCYYCGFEYILNVLQKSFKTPWGSLYASWMVECGI
jgi:hypothetical protein